MSTGHLFSGYFTYRKISDPLKVVKAHNFKHIPIQEVNRLRRTFSVGDNEFIGEGIRKESKLKQS